MGINEMLPPHPGALPLWMLFISATAWFNSVQNLFTLSLTKRVYNGSPEQVTPLQSRTFGIWTFTAAVVRFYCAYHIHERSVYELTLWTYVIAWTHFTSELFIFKSTKLGAGLAGPLLVSTTSLIWMWTQFDFYVKA